MTTVRVIGFLFLLFNGFMAAVFLWGGYSPRSTVTEGERKPAVVLGGVFAVLSVLAVDLVVTG